jgi:hypothetical protein
LTVKLTVVQDMTVSSFIDSFQRLQGTCFFFRVGDSSSRFLQNAGTYLSKYQSHLPEICFLNKDIILYASTCNVEVCGMVLRLKYKNWPVIASNTFTILSDFSVQYCVTAAHNCQFGIAFLRSTSMLLMSHLGSIPMPFLNQTKVCFRQFSCKRNMTCSYYGHNFLGHCFM